MTDTPREGPSSHLCSTEHHRGKLSRTLWTAAGTIFLSLGAVGIVIPLLPTTPFLLLAAACYARGSERMYNWMMTNKYFGKYLCDYREGRGIPLRVKTSALAFLWVVIGISAILATHNLAIRIALLVVGLAVSVHVLSIKPKRP